VGAERRKQGSRDSVCARVFRPARAARRDNRRLDLGSRRLSCPRGGAPARHSFRSVYSAGLWPGVNIEAGASEALPAAKVVVAEVVDSLPRFYDVGGRR